MRNKTIACGGCGETDPKKRCIGCLHDFGDPGSAWVNLPQAAAALTEAQATIARLEAALAPFAEAADECDEWGHDDENQAPVDAGQCRAARAALSPGKGE